METARTGIDNIEGDQWEEIPDDEERERALTPRRRRSPKSLRSQHRSGWLRQSSKPRLRKYAASGSHSLLSQRCVVAKKIQTARKALAVLDEALHDPHVMMQISRAWPAHPGDCPS